MGNIGNLNCDRSTYDSNNRSTSTTTTSNPSRIQRDLSRSPHQLDYMEPVDGTEAPMIRRAVGKIPHVCIVGAGVAGLRCADVLLQHGAKVTILEGRDRVGGRVCSTMSLKTRNG
jgi:alanine dehydrogenase